MQKIEYNLPVFKDGDIADLNEYSKQMAEAIKVQIDKFGNPLIFKGTVETLEELEYLTDVKNGYIYTVISEEKNYIYNGTEWIIYSDNQNTSLDVLMVDSLPTENIKEKTIYLLPNAKQAENNIYDEYIYINNNWEIVGSTAIDPENLKDSVPIGAIIEYEGDVVPEGYEKVEENQEINNYSGSGTLASSTLDTGIYTITNSNTKTRKILVVVNIKFNPNSANDRGLIVSTPIKGIVGHSVCKASNNNSTRLNVTAILELKPSEVINITSFQDSGASLNYTYNIQTIYID